MKDKINSILSEVKTKISEAANENELQNVKNAYVGKQGALSMLMKEMPKLDAALRPEMGKVLNQAKNQVTELINSKRTELKLKASEVSPDFDCSVPGILPPNGGLHPITQMCYDLNDAFRSMGFEIFQEDDITSELFAFDKLNFPSNHPARESMDTSSCQMWSQAKLFICASTVMTLQPVCVHTLSCRMIRRKVQLIKCI